jgi:hypothetical protein
MGGTVGTFDTLVQAEWGPLHKSRHLETSDDPIQILRDVRELCPEEEHPYRSGMATPFHYRELLPEALLDHVRYGAQEARQA